MTTHLPIPEILSCWERVRSALPPSNPSDPADPSVNLDTLAAIATAKWMQSDALVEIAKAARQVNETLLLRVRTTEADEARLTAWGVELNALNAALARLDSETAE